MEDNLSKLVIQQTPELREVKLDLKLYAVPIDSEKSELEFSKFLEALTPEQKLWRLLIDIQPSLTTKIELFQGLEDENDVDMDFQNISDMFEVHFQIL